MSISVGDSLPGATLSTMGADGPETVDFGAMTKGRKVVLFGLPGAFTGTCDAAHLPSFMRTADAFKEKGVEEIICVSVNDPFVMKRWDESAGASEAGITMLADPQSELTKALGLNFTVEPLGFYDRCQRFALLAEDGDVKVMNLEEQAGVCGISSGEELLEQV
ncbi:peroxiredoxin [Cognatishimia activa]|uniref:Glutathione-dependent peroxiredoxin n=1 Tax=Cognatishimia activa TaxID=1715691 RepID=A0A0P1J3J4_9RHOB|nr:peroxiredoxin [Cognatishimia activa]CUI35803.1 Putative peroxiredoxin [Cognatishimia activa]CUK24722.1 Putative peroxiredoxin [Cognatishimia activa]